MILRKSIFVLIFALIFSNIAGSMFANSKSKEQFLAINKKLPVVNFRKSKRILEKNIYRNNEDRIDYYCGCVYNKNKDVDPSGCGFKPKKAKTRRSLRIEWEHIVPAHYMGRNLSCWKSGGRKNCERKSREFNIREADLHNIIPTVGELNQYRSNYPYKEIYGERRMFGKCDFEVFNHTVEIRPSVQGDVARRFLYIIYKYKLKIPKEDINLMWKWHEKDPVSNKERIIDRRIKMYQGDSNPLLKDIYK